MRTLVLSDLHLGCGGDPGIFAGAHALVALLDGLATRRLRIILNGDTFDFPAQDPTGAGADVAGALTQDPGNARVLSALGRAIERDGELIVRGGRHDPQLELAAVQDHVLRGLQLSAAGARRVTFHAACRPTRCQVGRATVLVARTFTEDPIDDPLAAGPIYGLLNARRRQFGVGLPDLLRPHPGAAALTALAVNPTAIKHLLADLPDAGRRLLSALRSSPSLERAELSPREAEVLLAAIDPAVILGAAALDDGALLRARRKLLRAGLRGLTRASAELRELADDEWAGARALAHAEGATAVIAGHTHAAGWRADPGLVACDTGAWTWLPRTPAPGSDDDLWNAYLDQWQRIPRIDARRSGAPPVRLQLTAALLGARGRQAVLTLIEWRDGASLLLRQHEIVAAT